MVEASARLGKWFSYEGCRWPPGIPGGGPTVTTNVSWGERAGEFNAADWRKEDWLVCSALIPQGETEKLDEAGCVLTPHDLAVSPGWRKRDDFDFGEFCEVKGIGFHPWVITDKNPVTDDLRVQLRQDFSLYHGLEEREPGRFFHPLDGLLVAQVGKDTHQFLDPTPRVSVHTDFLRDFLAARGMALLVSIVADRFANAESAEQLELDEAENEEIDHWTWRTAIIHPPGTSMHKYWRGRAILRRHVVVEPYEKPKPERSVWPCFDLNPRDDSLPEFVLDTEGTKGVLDDRSCPAYLFFRSEVLARHLTMRGYRVWFHMRRWGGASGPRYDHSIDVGINSEGLVNAFAPDLCKLSASEQAHWAAHSVLPSGDVCGEMFQTRMMLDPPRSPGVVDLVEESKKTLGAAFQDRFGAPLFSSSRPENRELACLTVGPIYGEMHEVSKLSKTLYEWVIEPMKTESLRTGVQNPEAGWRQIKLLKEVSVGLGKTEAEASRMTAALTGLNELRIAAAHVGASVGEDTWKLLGLSAEPSNARNAWDVCVGQVVKALDEIGETLKG